MGLIKNLKLRKYKKHANANLKEIKKTVKKISGKIDPEQLEKIKLDIAEIENVIKTCDLPEELESKYVDFDMRVNKIIKPFKKSVFREYAEAIITAVILALLIRTFIVQAFKIPTGSMQPTLHGANYYGTGDRILVNKFIYGAKSPTGIMFTDIKLPYFQLPKLREPERGDVVVFTTDGISLLSEDEQKKDFIKRLIGLPGDTIEIVGLRREMLFTKCNYCCAHGEKVRIENPVKVFKPNGEIILRGECSKCRHIVESEPINPDEGVVLVNGKVLDSPEIIKTVPYLNEGPYGGRYKPIVVPENCYFVLGDNSPSSKDSRFWGYVPEENMRGMAFFIYWPLDRTRLIK